MPSGNSKVKWTLTGLVAVGLVIDAVVHFDLASAFTRNRTGALSEPAIFRAQATVAVLAVLLLLVRPRRYTAALTFVVAASALVAVVLYRYVDVGKIGPIPNMYDPYWAPSGKVISAVGEAIAAIASIGLFAILAGDNSRARR